MPQAHNPNAIGSVVPIWAGGAGGGSGPATTAQAVCWDVNQVAHGFSVEDVVYVDNAGVYQLADASDATMLGLLVVGAVAGVDDFTVCQSGRITSVAHGLTVGEYYFLSDTVPGQLSLTEPTDPASFSNPIVFVLDANTLLVLPFRPSGVADDPTINGFRLTPTMGVPVPTADVPGATIIYLTPYKHNRIGVWNQTLQQWTELSSAEISYTLAGRTAGTPFDIFGYDAGGGNLSLEVLDWTDATNRATALTRQDGVWVLSTNATRRYLGTCYPRALNTFDWVTNADTVTRQVAIDLWNVDNRVEIELFLYDSTDSFNYTVATTQLWRASAFSVIELIAGLSEEYFFGRLSALTTQSVSGTYRACFFGYDSAVAKDPRSTAGGTGSPVFDACGAEITKQVGLGFHYFSWLQHSIAAGATIWYGDNANPDIYQSGVVGSWIC